MCDWNNAYRAAKSFTEKDVESLKKSLLGVRGIEGVPEEHYYTILSKLDKLEEKYQRFTVVIGGESSLLGLYAEYAKERANVASFKTEFIYGPKFFGDFEKHIVNARAVIQRSVNQPRKAEKVKLPKEQKSQI